MTMNNRLMKIMIVVIAKDVIIVQKENQVPVNRKRLPKQKTQVRFPLLIPALDDPVASSTECKKENQPAFLPFYLP